MVQLHSGSIRKKAPLAAIYRYLYKPFIWWISWIV